MSRQWREAELRRRRNIREKLRRLRGIYKLAKTEAEKNQQYLKRLCGSPLL